MHDGVYSDATKPRLIDEIHGVRRTYVAFMDASMSPLAAIFSAYSLHILGAVYGDFLRQVKS